MLEIQTNSPIPIYEQLIAGIKTMIHKGELKVGESLPSIRNLASTLEVAGNTVARAYNELERAGFVKSFGVKGTFVCEKTDQGSDILSDLSDLLKSFINKGYSKEQIHQIIEEYFNELNK